ncbi:G patch domain-containing protein 1 [Orchesella cincta]|uniref:G patch domain-containing protein 1 n=1 Tax=Orchesella cincta TaxID=48709 RepID=A0A1D2MD56_ORCCI|nr:G patch domain-containing protein 1 [Orchesella cincta]
METRKGTCAGKDPKDDPKVAAKMKLFGRLTHNVMEWHPEKLVCKRSKFVGVKNDQSASSTTIAQAVLAVPVAKKSLFDNLDFSKRHLVFFLHS